MILLEKFVFYKPFSVGLKGLIYEFIDAAKEDKVEERGWAKSAYGMSKIAVSIMTRLQQQEFDAKHSEKNILVNCCCPGMVLTDMTAGAHTNGITPDEGADTPLHLALLPASAKEPRGEFWYLRKEKPFPPQ